MSKRGHDYSGLWISFEAGEGAGKGTQQEMLAHYLKEKGFVVEFGNQFWKKGGFLLQTGGGIQQEHTKAMDLKLI